MWFNPLKLLALFLSTVLLVQAGVAEKALTIPNGSPVKLKLKCGETHEVRLVRVEKQSIVVQPLQGGEQKSIPFSEIRKLNAVEEHINPGIVAVATVAVLFGISYLAAALR